MDHGVVTIVTRDINGRRGFITGFWSEICSTIEGMKDNLEDDEILLITTGGTCIYSSLGRDSIITWDDVTGFFA